MTQSATKYAPANDIAERFLKECIVTRIWDRDISVWAATPGSVDARSISTRLGWLDVDRTMGPELDRVHRLGESARREHIRSVYLLGMGGSSLCAEVMRSVYGAADGYPNLLVLDTTDDHSIAGAASAMDARRTWFIVASKSGSTVEVSSLERFFRARVAATVGAQAGKQFIAITDPGTVLQQHATAHGYREVFLNPADIGGRFSALSLFGLVPAALIGLAPAQLLSAGTAMAQGCRQEGHANAGFELGAFIGGAALDGRDKLTLALPPSLASLGLWIEQLIAESTGKHGKGALPVVDEPLGVPADYGSDRVFVSIATERDEPDPKKLHALEEAGFPVLRLSTRIDGLGAEFFRWEFATAIAGAALGINPFDEPNVAEAKEKTQELLAAFESRGALPEPPPTATADDIRKALATLRAKDYVAFLSYLPGNADVEPAIREIRDGLREKFKVATTFGHGPRYLHSTGQYHKGGPNSVLAFVLTGDDATQTPIPESPYTFSVLRRAQGLGDAETLAAHGRRTVRIHFPGAATHAPARLEKLFEEAMSS
jgi:glucose-6-phosphate isomerase